MATKQSTVDFILDQLISIDNINTRKMFGEYALYCDGKVVGLICDDILFIKITELGKNFVGEYYKEGLPYPGAKPWMKINEERIDDNDWLAELIHITADNLPAPKPKKSKK
ncbi:MAG TPA: TfoX/Sxy family protein [Candidatus Udaeobacter sp.]|nr:TfoX/Sxy family protein [Candidatus Udaeobacter sp.]